MVLPWPFFETVGNVTNKQNEVKVGHQKEVNRTNLNGFEKETIDGAKDRVEWRRLRKIWEAC